MVLLLREAVRWRASALGGLRCFNLINAIPGCVQGWGVVEGDPPDWKFAGIFETRQEAQVAAAEAGPGYGVRWGSYDERTKQFFSGSAL
jgi:hypothetical protein